MSALIFLISVVLMLAFDSDKLTVQKRTGTVSVGYDLKEFQSFAHQMRLQTLRAQETCDRAKAVFQ